ncbi:MAG: hypothetical protein ABIH46_07065, partial [Chloroflexota bacterium]
MSSAIIRKTTARSAVAVRSLSEREEVLAHLEQDRIYAAYAIGQAGELSQGKYEAMLSESAS